MIIEKSEDFLKAQNFVQKIINVKQELPDQVFKEGFGNFVFEEFDLAEAPEFWDTSIKALAQTYGDTEIIVMIIDSDLHDYYIHGFDFYPAMRMPLTFTGKDYWKEIQTGPSKKPTDAPYISADKVVWIPTSGKWAIWGQRSYCVCILGFAADTTVKVPQEQSYWRSASEALTSLIDNNFKGRIAPKEFADPFLANYTNPPHNKTIK